MSDNNNQHTYADDRTEPLRAAMLQIVLNPNGSVTVNAPQDKLLALGLLDVGREAILQQMRGPQPLVAPVISFPHRVP